MVNLVIVGSGGGRTGGRVSFGGVGLLGGAAGAAGASAQNHPILSDYVKRECKVR